MSSKFANQILKEFSCFDDISIKTFFGGFSINSKSTMFGWIGKTGFYLRGHPYYRDFFIESGMQPLNLPTSISTKSLDYYKVSDEWFRDREKLYSIVKMVIEYTQHEQSEKNKLKEQRIKELPNMTLSLEKLLFSVGIINIPTFHEIGYLEAYNRIKNKKASISNNILFILYASLHRRHVASLSQSTKNEIELAYQNFLEQKAKNT
ncbi:TfoX/Sxy family protein [uncultured Gilliamella sp.]|jgi:Regulator of competence-specific genes|uniref:TfoX/Sxy family protein n=2 Tax=uncultured Gilliamella sp. TaxID=1193505 RepID=UPI0025E4BCD1|nr:TfoX/Sxy family protein [uncultured Gilliamella sp.]